MRLEFKEAVNMQNENPILNQIYLHKLSSFSVWFITPFQE